MKIEMHNLDGNGLKRTNVYELPIVSHNDFWENVTNIPCPVCSIGAIRWAEAGYVSGYRICDRCGRHFLAKGNKDNPKLLRVGSRRDRIKKVYEKE